MSALPSNVGRTRLHDRDHRLVSLYVVAPQLKFEPSVLVYLGLNRPGTNNTMLFACVGAAT